MGRNGFCVILAVHDLLMYVLLPLHLPWTVYSTRTGAYYNVLGFASLQTWIVNLCFFLTTRCINIVSVLNTK